MKFVRIAAPLVLAFVAAAPVRAEGLIDLAPADSEIVARMDVKKVVQSPLFRMLVDQRGHEQTDAQLKVLKNLTDLDVYNDIDEIALFGRIDEDASMTVVARGKFNQEKLLDLVRLNDTYKKADRNGVTIHSWTDDGNKHACFLPDGLLAVAGSAEAMDALLQTRANPEAGFRSTAQGKLAPANGGAAFTAMLVRTPTIDCDFGNFARAASMQLATATVDLTDAGVAGRLLCHPDRPELAPAYLDVARGMLAGASLYADEEPMARLAAETLAASLTDDKSAVQVAGTLSNEKVLQLAKEHAD